MALLSLPQLIVVCWFVLVHRCDSIFHWLHRICFSGLTFYLWPSDEKIRALLPRGGPLAAVASTLPSKARKRLAKRAGIDPRALSPHVHANDGAPVEITVAAISDNLYVAAGASSFEQFQFYVALHLALFALLLVEQAYICYNTTSTLQSDGIMAVQYGFTVTSSTVTLLCLGLLYNVWVGLATLTRLQHVAGGAASKSSSVRSILRTGFVIGFLMFMLSLFVQALPSQGASLTSQFIGAKDAATYTRFANQLAYNALEGLHATVSKAQEVAGTTGGVQSELSKYLPALPADGADGMHVTSFLPFHLFRVVLALLCAAMSVSFFGSAVRYANLLHDKLEQNSDALAEGTTTGAIPAAPATAASSADDEPEAATGTARLRLYASNLLHTLNFLSPLFIVVLWLPPLSSQLWLSVFALRPAAAGVEDGPSDQQVHESLLRAWASFELFRIACVVACLLLRLCLLRSYLQVWLLSAMSAIKRLPAASAPTVEQHIAVRMQSVLQAVWAYTPMAALQIVYPVVVSLALLAAWKLASEWVPAGSGLEVALARGGWGVCHALTGQGCSLFDVSHVLRSYNNSTASTVTPTAPPVADVVAPPPPEVEFDADEFDGDIAALVAEEEHATVQPLPDALPAAADASSLPVSLPPTAWSLTPLGFVSPARANLLAVAVGFLLWWAHFVWFVETALCFSYLRFVRPAEERAEAKANRAVTRVEVEQVTGEGSKKSSAANSGLHQRNVKQA